MDGILRLLKEHRLTSERSLARDLSRFGRGHLQILLRELAAYQEPPRAAPPGEFTFFPAGGRLGLGSAERPARGLLLIADHIVLPNDLGPKAGELLAKLEHEGNLDDVRNRLNFALHPYLCQYLRLQPLFQEGLASLAARPLVSTSLVHPMAHGLKREFLRWAEHGVTNVGQPWMVLRIAPNYWSAFGDMRAGEVDLIPAKPLVSTDDLIKPEGGFKPQGRGVRRLEPEELLSDAHPLAEAFEEFISAELFHVQMLAEAANRLKASLVTDIDTDWDILDLLATRTEEGKPVDHPGELVASLGESLSFIDNVPIDALVRLRVDRSTEFDSFRAVLFQINRELSREADPERRYRAAHRAVVEEIQPRFAEYNAKMTALARERGLAASVAAGTASLTLMFALLGGESRVVGGALAGAISYIGQVLHAQRQLDMAQGDPMFFLWKLKQAAK